MSEVKQFSELASMPTSVSNPKAVAVDGSSLGTAGFIPYFPGENLIDLNEVKTTCIIELAVNCPNTPVQNAQGMVLISIVTSASIKHQKIFRGFQGGLVYFRTYTPSDGWSQWKNI